ncbi:MAG: polysaccharide biosynthesis protein, partial [Tomitella sp.]|nr:polysaccharide biosynthesis protein [Tomitella sp.]
VVLGAAGAGKVLPAVAVLMLGFGAAGALVASAAGTAVVVVVARAIVTRVADRDSGEAGVRESEATGMEAAEFVVRSTGVTAVIRASQVQLVLIVLTSIDLMMARVVLGETDAGLYAMGAVATKAAFWLPAAVGVVLFPRMSRPEHSMRAVRATLAGLTALGVLVVGVAAGASPLIPVLVGEEYRPVVGLLWLFALVGATLAVLQGALLSTIARETTRLAGIAWAGLAVEGTALAFASTVSQMGVTAAACALGTTAAVTVAVLWSVSTSAADRGRSSTPGRTRRRTRRAFSGRSR